MNIILASGSPRRKKLLQQINLEFEVHPSSINENYEPNLSPDKIVCTLAMRKAADIAPKHANALIIGADTIVTFKNNVLEKPATPDDAINMLHQLSGQTHNVFTGVALCKTDHANNILDRTTFSEVTKVTFGDLDPNDIATYVAGGSPMDKAGSYGIQDDFGAIFVKRIEGDYNNVVGFPLHSFYNTVQKFAGTILPNTGSSRL